MEPEIYFLYIRNLEREFVVSLSLVCAYVASSKQ